MPSSALQHLRLCDFTGQLAGAGATRFLAAFGAQIIRIEDPVRQGRWDILRGTGPFVDDRRGNELGGAFNNHNAGKLGVTINLRDERGKDLLRKLVAECDAVAENFSAGTMERLGFGYEALRAIKPDIIYVSNNGFGQSGPYQPYKSWGPIVQAMSGLTSLSGLPDLPPAGLGYSYMDHHGGYTMAIAIMMALHHRNQTGEGQWVDMSCTEAGASMLGPVALDYTVNGRHFRRPEMPNSNRSQSPAMAPHGIYPARGEDCWVAIACRHEHDWQALSRAIGTPRAEDARFARLTDRLANEDALDQMLGAWTRERDPFDVELLLQAAGIPASAVRRPEERIDGDPSTDTWGLWPTAEHDVIGRVRVDGLGVHLSEDDWEISRGAPLLGQHNKCVFGDLLGLSSEELDSLHEAGVI